MFDSPCLMLLYSRWSVVCVVSWQGHIFLMYITSNVNWKFLHCKYQHKGRDGHTMKNKTTNTRLSEQVQNPVEKSQKEGKSTPITHNNIKIVASLTWHTSSQVSCHIFVIKKWETQKHRKEYFIPWGINKSHMAVNIIMERLQLLTTFYLRSFYSVLTKIVILINI